MSRRKQRNRYLDDLSRAILHRLGKFGGWGFSYRIIAALAFRVRKEQVTDGMVSSVAGFFSRNGYSVGSYRRAETQRSWEFGVSKARLPRRRRRQRRSAA